MKRKTMNDKPEKPQPPDEPAGPESGALIEPSEEAIARLEGELADMKDKYLRLAAEYDNFKKRSVKERTEAWQRPRPIWCSACRCAGRSGALRPRRSGTD